VKNREQTGRCPNCNKILTLEISKKKETCPDCKFLFDVKDAIASYKIFQKAQEAKAKQELEKLENIDYTKEAEYELNLNNYDKAMLLYEKALEENSSNAEAWFGLVKCQTKRFTDYNEDTHEEEFYKALTFADDKQRESMLNMYNNYLNARENYANKRTKITTDRIAMFKDARARSLNQSKKKLETNLQAHLKVENVFNIFTCIVFGLLFTGALIFGGIRIFSAELNGLQRTVSILGILTLCFAMSYYIYTKFMFVHYAKIICHALFNQEESISNIASLIGKKHYETINVLTSLHNKGFIPGYNIYEKEYILFTIDPLNNITNNTTKQTSKIPAENTQNETKNSKKLSKIDKILKKK